MKRSYRTVFSSFLIYSALAICLSSGCTAKKMATKQIAFNSRLESDKRLDRPLKINALYPAWNKTVASYMNESADYFYTQNFGDSKIIHKIAIYNLYAEDYTIQWTLDGTDIPGANGVEYALPFSIAVGDHLVSIKLFNKNGELVDEVTWVARIIAGP